MRKAGTLIVVIVALLAASHVYADDLQSLIGEKVDGVSPLMIDGNRAAKDVIVINGTSYLTVRVSGEMFGYDVDYEDGTVLLNKKQEPVSEIDAMRAITNQMLEEEIRRVEGLEKMYQGILDTVMQTPGGGVSDSHMALMQEYYTKISRVQMELSYLRGLRDVRKQSSLLP